MGTTPDNAANAVDRPDYGIDAPGLVRGFFLAGSAMAILLAVLVFLRPAGGGWTGTAKAGLFVASGYCVGMGCLMLYWSKITKVIAREWMLDLVRWRGDERVLDVGCGRGLMLVGAALRLTTGRAIGIDIWSAADQSANGPDGALGNARIAGVVDRIEVLTADMLTLPFADRSFDIVLSHWAVHNLKDQAARDTALAEMARVLRPGGAVILCDIAHRDAYAARLRDLGLPPGRIIVSSVIDAVLAVLSFGTFRPSTIVAHRPA
jgi:arsenite methyltransferase